MSAQLAAVKQKTERFFLMNRATQKAFESLDRVVARETIGIFVANPGVAKSYSIKAWRRKHGDVRPVWLEAYAGTRPRQLIYGLAQGLGLGRLAAPNLDGLRIQICDALAAQPRLIIIDEADLLRVMTFDLLRSIWDQVSEMRDADGEQAFPLALFGTPHLREMLMREDLERLRRRVDLVAELPPMNLKETELAVRGKWPHLKIDDEGLVELHQLSRGSFGWLNRIMDKAEDLAAKDGRVITARIVRATASYLIGLEPGGG